MNDRIAIYTCIAGSYDNLMQPYEPAEGFDFICFVPFGMKTKESIGHWKIKEIPFCLPDNTITARYPKLNPGAVIGEYEWSLWIDGNIAIKDNTIYEICRKLQSEGVCYAGITHPYRDCTYEEALVILKNRRESFKNVFKSIHFLHSKGLKRHSGLQETNMIFRNHSDKSVKDFDNLWWDSLVNHAAGHRDQLMHTYSMLSTQSLTPYPLLPDGKNTRNYPGVEYIGHTGYNREKKKPYIIRKTSYFKTDIEIVFLKCYIWLFVE